MKIAKIVYQLCDYTDFRADFPQTRICGKWLVFANQVTYITVKTKGLFQSGCRSSQLQLLTIYIPIADTMTNLEIEEPSCTSVISIHPI